MLSLPNLGIVVWALVGFVPMIIHKVKAANTNDAIFLLICNYFDFNKDRQNYYLEEHYL
jgi:hypothetical protein